MPRLPARLGSPRKYPGQDFDEVENHLSQNWNTARGKSHLSWEQARPAVQDSWKRVTEMGEDD